MFMMDELLSDAYYFCAPVGKASREMSWSRNLYGDNIALREL
jgi:hypothetical protein